MNKNRNIRIPDPRIHFQKKRALMVSGVPKRIMWMHKNGQLSEISKNADKTTETILKQIFMKLNMK